MSAPPIAMIARQAISHQASWARAPSSEKTTKIAIPAKNARRWPKMSPSRPPVTISTPKISE